MIEKGEAFDIIYTDIEKAFDSVAHVRLMHKYRYQRCFIELDKIIFKWKDSMCKRR